MSKYLETQNMILLKERDALREENQYLRDVLRQEVIREPQVLASGLCTLCLGRWKDQYEIHKPDCLARPR